MTKHEYNAKIYKGLCTLSGMTRKNIAEQARKGIDAGIGSLNFGKYDVARRQFESVVENIISTQIINRVRNNYRGEHKNYIATAAFGQGFAEGIIEHESIIRLPKNLERFAQAAYELYTASNHRWSYQPEVHRKIGKGYGVLGLKKEGLKILDFGRTQGIYHGYCGQLERL